MSGIFIDNERLRKEANVEKNHIRYPEDRGEFGYPSLLDKGEDVTEKREHT